MIKVICIGKLKENYLKEGINDYLTRISTYHKINLIELADKIEKTFIGYANISFIIGGSDGLHDEIKNKCHYKLSFSHLTFPHGLFRLILLEQIYRSFKIINHETYHK